jgi:CheY-like chemotaxis protein
MNYTMLFIEDDEDDVYVIETSLDRVGIHEPRHFLANGKMAVEYFESLTSSSNSGQNLLPKIILLDLNMPLMNGLEFLEWRRQQATVSTIPVVVLTSSENPQDIVDAYRLGANAYLVKPMAMVEFSSLLKSIHAFWLTHNRFAI